MNMCRHHNITLWNIHRENEIFFCIRADEFLELMPLAVKARVRLHLLEKRGFPFFLAGVRKKWTFYSGFFLFLALLWVLSSFIWEITYNGQSSYSKETLAKTVTSMEVYTGMKRSRLNCDAIEKRLREVYPDISWVSAEEIGSVLKISIKEGKKTITHEKSSAPVHLVSLYNGTVKDIMVNRGTARVKKGQKVKKGEILISGIVPVTDDNNEVADKMAVAAKGEVAIEVEQSFQEPLSVRYPKKVYTGRTISAWSYRLGNHRFSIKNPLKRFHKSYKYDIINTICADRIIHPFSFRIQMAKKEYREYRIQKAVYSKEELKRAGMKRYQQILSNITENKMQLLSHSAVLKQKDRENWILQGKISFLCKKMGVKKVTEKEKQIKKAEDGKNGESGENS